MKLSEEKQQKLEEFFKDQFYKKELYYQYKDELKNGNPEYFCHRVLFGYKYRKGKKDDIIHFLQFVTKCDNYIIELLTEE